jgi:preprotein translocase subunit YajC
MGAGAEGGGQGGLGAFVPLILMFVIFYFLLIRPQQKKQKLHREMIGNLKKGDRVITSGGLHGRITGLTDTVVTLEISEKVRVKVARGNISGKVEPETVKSKA